MNTFVSPDRRDAALMIYWTKCGLHRPLPEQLTIIGCPIWIAARHIQLAFWGLCFTDLPHSEYQP